MLVPSASTTNGRDGPLPFTIGASHYFLRAMDAYLEEGWSSLIKPPAARTRLVLAAFTETTDVRRRGPVRKAIAKAAADKLGAANQKVPLEKSLEALADSRFVLSPEGNGIDCHRHYEALLMGAVPIVEDSPMARAKYAGCPVLYTLTADLAALSVESLEAQYAALLEQTFDFSAMFLSHYGPEHAAEIRANGEHWLKLRVPAWFAARKELLWCA